MKKLKYFYYIIIIHFYSVVTFKRFIIKVYSKLHSTQHSYIFYVHYVNCKAGLEYFNIPIKCKYLIINLHLSIYLLPIVNYY